MVLPVVDQSLGRAALQALPALVAPVARDSLGLIHLTCDRTRQGVLLRHHTMKMDLRRQWHGNQARQPEGLAARDRHSHLSSTSSAELSRHHNLAMAERRAQGTVADKRQGAFQGQCDLLSLTNTHRKGSMVKAGAATLHRSEEHTSELQSHS